MTIVVGYLPTAEGRAALSVAAQEAASHSARLIVVASMSKEDRVAAERDLDEVEQVLAAQAIGCEVREVPAGRGVADDLMSVAEDLAATLLVIGLRRRSPVGKLILGSKAQRILLEAPCPVLTVKPDVAPARRGEG